jgi:threonyl-tRNA synthetase
MENATTYRDEKSGELHGLSRVRAISMDDGHVFCRPDQIEAEMRSIMMIIGDMYSALNLEWYAMLSFRDDSDKYLGSPELWQKAQDILKKVADELGLEYKLEEGEAAFYGPKIDIMVKDGMGREWQCATEQLDFVQPERFGLEYVVEDGSKQRPVMIHKALLGSVERFLSVYIEHTAGKFPVWLAPEQVRVVTVNQEGITVNFANEIADKAKDTGVRLTVDNSNESVSKKIRTAELMKIPYTIVVGEKEINERRVKPRIRKDLAVLAVHPDLDIDDFLKTVANETKSRVSKTSL